MKRYLLPDLLKGFAVFLIIPVHIVETFIDHPGRESLFAKTLLLLGGPIAVPVFMIVMGYFVAASRKSTSQIFFRGVKIFVLGLLLNIGLNFHLLLKIKYDGWQFDPLEYIFGVDIFYFAGLSIIFLSFLKHIKKGQEWVVFFLILLVSGLTSLMNNWLMVTERNYILPFIAGTYSWSYFPLFPWLSYVFAGFFFQKTEPRIMELAGNNKIASFLGGALIFGLVAIFAKSGISTTINLPDYYHHTFWFFLWAIGVVILWSLLVWFLSRKFSASPMIVFLRWMGKNITAFYIIQWLIIGNIATSIYQTQKLSVFGYWFGAIFLVTVSLTYLTETLKSVLIKQKVE